MAKNRVIYQSEALMVGQREGTDGPTERHIGTGNFTDIKQLHRVQSANYAFNISRTDVNQFGELAAIDRVVLDTPTVSLDFSYLLSNMTNEEFLGFKVNTKATQTDDLVSALSGVLNKTVDEKNYFIQTSREGEDAIGDTDRDKAGTARASTIGIGNGFITSYSSEASVGSFPTVSVAVEGMNMNFSTGTIDVPLPSIDRINGTAATGKATLPDLEASPRAVGTNTGILAISTLRPGDITIKIAEHTQGDASFGTTNYNDSIGGAKLPTFAGDATNSANIQSYNLSFDLGRSPIQRLGNRFAFAREIDFPVNASLSIDAIVTDLTDGNLNDLIDCEKSYDIQIILKGITGSACDSNKTEIASYIMKNMRPDSQSYSSSIGDNKTVTLDFTTQIGGPRDTEAGVYFKGVTDGQTDFDLGRAFAS